MDVSTPRAIELHIGELVLHGLPPGDRYRIADAIEHELARLLVERGLSPALAGEARIARLDAGGFDVPPGAKPAGIAAGVAQALHGALAR